jgi:hypothetical protein
VALAAVLRALPTALVPVAPLVDAAVAVAVVAALAVEAEL